MKGIMNKILKTLILAILLFSTNLVLEGRETSKNKSDSLTMHLKFDNKILQINASYIRRLKKGETLSSSQFVLNPSVKIRNVKANGLRSFKFVAKANRPFPYLFLEFDSFYKHNGRLVVNFEYEIDLQKHNHINSNWIELNTDKLWFPNYGDIDNKFTSKIFIENLPKEYSLISNQDTKIKKIKEGNYKLVNSHPSYEVFILAGENMNLYKYKNDSNIRLKFFAYKGVSKQKLNSMGLKVIKITKFFNKTFGKTKPIRKLVIALRRTPWKELSYQFAQKGVVVTEIHNDYYADLSHEISHQWWSGADFIREPWLNESFANYSMYLVLERFDKTEYERIFSRHQKVSKKNVSPVISPLFSKNSFNAYYIKGAVVLKKLEKVIGEEKMMALLSNRVKKRINSSQLLMDEVESLAGVKIRKSFRDILHGTTQLGNKNVESSDNKIPVGKSVTIDGKAEKNEWADAKFVKIKVKEDWEIKVFFKQDGKNLYFRFSNLKIGENQELYPEVLIDTKNDKSQDWKEDDWWFHTSYSNCEGQGLFNNYKTCKKGTKKGWNGNNFPIMIGGDVEMSISKELIGVKAGDVIGMAFDATDTQKKWFYYPEGGKLQSPKTWKNFKL